MQKEIWLKYQPSRSIWNLFVGLSQMLLGFIMGSNSHIVYSVFFFLGIIITYSALFPASKTLVVKAGLAWPWNLKEKTQEKNRILSIQTIEGRSYIETETENYLLAEKDMNLEALESLAALKAHYTMVMEEPKTKAEA